MRRPGNRTPPVVAPPGFRRPRWLLLFASLLVLTSIPASAQAQSRGAKGTVDMAATAIPRGPPELRAQGSHPPRSHPPPFGEDRYVPDEVLVEVAGQAPSSVLKALAARHRLAPLQSHTSALTDSTWHLWRIADDRPVAMVIRALGAERWIRSVQPSYRYELP